MNNIFTNLGWKHIKNFVDAVNSPAALNYIENWHGYHIWLYYQGITFSCELLKDSDDCVEFETYYKPYVKRKVSSDGFEIKKNQSKDRNNYTYFTDYGDNIQNQTRGNGEELLFELSTGVSQQVKYLEFLDTIYIKDGILKYFNAGWDDHFTFEIVCPIGKYLPNGQLAEQEVVLNRFINKCHIYQTGTQQFFTEDFALLPAGYQFKVTATNNSSTTWKAIVTLKLYREYTM